MNNIQQLWNYPLQKGQNIKQIGKFPCINFMSKFFWTQIIDEKGDEISFTLERKILIYNENVET